MIKEMFILTIFEIFLLTCYAIKRKLCFLILDIFILGKI